MDSKWITVEGFVKSEEDILKGLKAEHFEGAPITAEPDGDYQVIKIYGRNYYRNVETGKVVF